MAAGSGQRIVLVDADGLPTDDIDAAVAGEVTELGSGGQPVRRTRFTLAREQLPWLPLSEPAFLLWVLAALVCIWALVGVFLRLT